MSSYGARDTAIGLLERRAAPNAPARGTYRRFRRAARSTAAFAQNFLDRARIRAGRSR